jgi:probable rRNA maturation factor
MPTKRTPRKRRARSGPGRIDVQVVCRTARDRLPPPRRLRALARAAAGRDARITLRVVGAAEARSLNRAYRGRDYATNVLAFDYGTNPRAPLGDIVLCHPVLAREARAQRKPLAAHYAHLVVHGALHLRGYDHGAARDAARMERRETRVLARFGLPDPYLIR